MYKYYVRLQDLYDELGKLPKLKIFCVYGYRGRRRGKEGIEHPGIAIEDESFWTRERLYDSGNAF